MISRPTLAAALAVVGIALTSDAAEAGDVAPQSQLLDDTSQLARSADDGDDEAPWGGTPENTLQLSLRDAIAQGLENNLNVQVERYGPWIANEDQSIAWGAYDPIFEAEMGYADDQSPNSFGINRTPISIVETLGGSGGFVGTLPLIGSEYSAKLISNRITTNSTVERLSPQYRSITAFSLRQPLLRGFLWNAPWTQVKLSKIGYTASLEEFRLQLMDIVATIIDAYWVLVASHQDRSVAEKSLEASKALLEQTRTQYDVGVISRVEVTEAEAGVADREFRLIVADNLYRDSQDNLIALVLGEQLQPLTTLAIEPTDRADDYVTYDIDVEEATRIAMASRPELALANENIDRLEIEEKFAKHERLPQLDVVGTYAFEGLSGKQNPNNDPCSFSDDPLCDPILLAAPTMTYGDSYDDFYANDGAGSWSVRGFFSIPIPNTTARHRATQSSIELRQARTEKRRVELGIVRDVRAAARNIKSSQEGIEAAERRVAAAAEQLRAEEIRLEYGESTPFDVLLREEDLVEAEGQKINAYLGYRTSVTALDRQQGTILRNQNIVIDDVLAVR